MEMIIQDKVLEFRRVSYGNPDTPKEMREYKIKNLYGSPVGTIAEIRQMIKGQNLDVEKIVLEEFDGSFETINIE